MTLGNLYLVVFMMFEPVTVLILTWLAFDWKTPEQGKGPAGAVLPPAIALSPFRFIILRGCGQFPGSPSACPSLGS